MGASPQRVYAFPHWQPAYHAALIQTDFHKLFELVQAAEKSILESLEEIADSPVHQVERQAIFDAHGTLAFLKRDAQTP